MSDLGDANRRLSDRIPGPFDAWRVGRIDTPVRLYDLGMGGCFVHAMHEQEPGVEMVLKLLLPDDGFIELKAETIYRRAGYGFAVRFVDVPESVKVRLQTALDKVRGDLA